MKLTKPVLFTFSIVIVVCAACLFIYFYFTAPKPVNPAQPGPDGVMVYHHFNDLKAGEVYSRETPGPFQDFLISVGKKLEVQAVEGSNLALMLDGTQGGETVMSRYFLPQENTMTAEVKFKPQVPGNVVVLELSNHSRAAASIEIDHETLYYRGINNKRVTLAEKVSSERWHTIKLVATPSKDIDIYLNERLAASDSLSNVKSINKISSSANGAALLLDDLITAQGQFDVPMGFGAAVRLPVGGLGGKTVLVTNAEELKNALKLQEPAVIVIKGTIDLSEGDAMLSTSSDKTIVGLEDAVILKGGLRMNGVENVVVRNITFDKSRDDSIEIRNKARHIWIDHNTFGTQGDGGVDIRLESSYVTLSWNHFKESGKSSLVGSDDSNTGDRGHLKLTYHHNLFENTRSRNPMVRFGEVHVFNNYYLGVKNYGIRAYTEGAVLSDSNFFRNTKTPMEIVNGTLQERGSYFEQSGNALSNGTVFEPAQDYTYSLDPVHGLDKLISEWAGAGKIDISSYERLLTAE